MTTSDVRGNNDRYRRGRSSSPENMNSRRRRTSDASSGHSSFLLFFNGIMRSQDLVILSFI